MATAHPTLDQLDEYACGSASDGMSLLIAAHLTYCSECRSNINAMEDICGAALTIGSSEDIAAPSADLLLQKLDADPTEESSHHASFDDRLPFPLQNLVGSGLDDLDWKFRLPGLHEYSLEGFDGEKVSLLRGKPGAGMFDHTHEGDEATLILTGQMADGGKVYKRGDVSIADHTHDHHPQIVGDEVCYCLIVLSGGMKFTGRFSRVLNLLPV